MPLVVGGHHNGLATTLVIEFQIRLAERKDGVGLAGRQKGQAHRQECKKILHMQYF